MKPKLVLHSMAAFVVLATVAVAPAQGGGGNGGSQSIAIVTAQSSPALSTGGDGRLCRFSKNKLNISIKYL